MAEIFAIWWQTLSSRGDLHNGAEAMEEELAETKKQLSSARTRKLSLELLRLVELVTTWCQYPYLVLY